LCDEFPPSWEIFAVGVQVLIGIMGCLTVVAVYFWLVRKPDENQKQ
jgi:hypothetical protein